MAQLEKYDWFNRNLFNIIPSSAQRILDVGCDTGLLGRALKQQNPDRHVAGLEVNPTAGELARQHLDAVYLRNAETDDLDDIEEEFDAIILGDVLEHLTEPLVALRKLRPLLADHGELYTSIPNIQHYSIFRRLLKGDFQYRESGLLDATHLRFFCLANIDKLLLDAGYLPRLHNRIIKKDEGLADHVEHLLGRLGLPKTNRRDIETFQYQHTARKMPPPLSDEITPLSIVVHSQYSGIFNDNFNSSPVIKGDHPHQVISFDRRTPLAEAWNLGIKDAEHRHIVLVREQVYLPHDWDRRLGDRIRDMEQLAGDNWIAGATGCAIGHDGGLLIGEGLRAPGEKDYPLATTVSPAQTLNDAVLVIPKGIGLRIDRGLGEHLHGVDLSMQVGDRRGYVYALNNPCLDNGPYSRRKPPGYEKSRNALLDKWRVRAPFAAPPGNYPLAAAAAGAAARTANCISRSMCSSVLSILE